VNKIECFTVGGIIVYLPDLWQSVFMNPRPLML